jgi:hypothetical protein
MVRRAGDPRGRGPPHSGSSRASKAIAVAQAFRKLDLASPRNDPDGVSMHFENLFQAGRSGGVGSQCDGQASAETRKALRGRRNGPLGFFRRRRAAGEAEGRRREVYDAHARTFTLYIRPVIPLHPRGSRPRCSPERWTRTATSSSRPIVCPWRSWRATSTPCRTTSTSSGRGQGEPSTHEETRVGIERAPPRGRFRSDTSMI